MSDLRWIFIAHPNIPFFHLTSIGQTWSRHYFLSHGESPPSMQFILRNVSCVRDSQMNVKYKYTSLLVIMHNSKWMSKSNSKNKTQSSSNPAPVATLTSLTRWLRCPTSSSPTRRPTTCPSCWTASSRTTTTASDQTLLVTLSQHSSVQCSVQTLCKTNCSLCPGPSLLIEVNMQVRSMGPISEMDMVSAHADGLHCPHWECCRATSWIATSASPGLTRGSPLRATRTRWRSPSRCWGRSGSRTHTVTPILSLQGPSLLMVCLTAVYNGKKSYLHTITTPNRFVR